MSKYLSVILGACLFAFIGFLCASGLSHVYEKQFAKSQDDMDSFAVFLVLVVIPAFAVGGGAVGFFGHRNLTLRSRGARNAIDVLRWQKTILAR